MMIISSQILLLFGFKLFFETRGEDDIVELLCKIGQTQIPSSDPLPILRGSGSGGREENTPLPPPLPHQNLFIQEDEMSSWPHHPLRQDYLCSELYASTPAPHPQSSVSLAPPPPKPPSSAPYDQIIAPRSAPRIQGTEEARGSTSRKRSRAAEMHNLAERRRREKINERMKTLQQLIPRCNKSTKVSMLEDVIEYVKSLEMQINQFMPHMAMGMNQPPAYIPFPSQAHMAGVGPSYPPPRYPFPNIQTFDPSRVWLQSPQPNPVSNQPQMNPYGQFVGHHQMQQSLPPPLQVILSQYPLCLFLCSNK
ncbi:Myc-type basic helix-loop-helix (bHLH) domain [Arabidopsis thaliana x Arabidopsis arenosa]|uniref:Myc-type basic helix-loop-helix (BHLH) domain n=1 Tax=Arabidopsis thaliana x Arabidopsis arenosa TaxID=1240361 RepID=A0A8T2E6B9_9BRAS|nr:Myc-type basic helix-loop-helix (bHLH) domain [Arabidopsis thaliana x Arabidopsis arenosa]